MRNRLYRKRLAVAVAAALAAALVLGVVLRLGDDPTPADTGLRRATVAMSDTLVSGAEFRVSYEARSAADVENMEPPIALELRRNGRAVNSLLALEAAGEPPIRPPGAGIPLIGTKGHRGPFEFRLPELEPGRYQLCGTVSYGGLPQQREAESFCRSVRVVARRQ